MFCLTSSDSLCVSDNLKSERSFDQGALERLTSAEKMQLCEATGGLWEVVASSSPLFQLWQTLVRVPNWREYDKTISWEVVASSMFAKSYRKYWGCCFVDKRVHILPLVQTKKRDAQVPSDLQMSKKQLFVVKWCERGHSYLVERNTLVRSSLTTPLLL